MSFYIYTNGISNCKKIKAEAMLGKISVSTDPACLKLMPLGYWFFKPGLDTGKRLVEVQLWMKITLTDTRPTTLNPTSQV